MSAPFTPVSPNPYIVGNPVRGRAMFFGRDAEFQLIRKRFEHAERGGLLVLCGERRSGKTSILFQILDHRLGPDFIPVLIDMQSMSVASEPEFLARVGDEILAALGGPGTLPLPDYSQTGSAASVFARFVQGCLTAHPGRKLILLFDEYELFENKIESGVLSPDVLGILAALMEHASVFMVFTGSQTACIPAAGPIGVSPVRVSADPVRNRPSRPATGAPLRRARSTRTVPPVSVPARHSSLLAATSIGQTQPGSAVGRSSQSPRTVNAKSRDQRVTGERVSPQGASVTVKVRRASPATRGGSSRDWVKGEVARVQVSSSRRTTARRTTSTGAPSGRRSSARTR
jgi:hypothetical protein